MKLKILNSSSSGNCYALENKNDIGIIDCGIPYKEILKGINFAVNKIKFALCCHSHFDHSKSINELMKKGVDAYVSHETAMELSLTGHRLHIIKELEEFKIGEFTIMGFPLQHDVHNLGFLIHHPEMGKLLYITDTYYCQYTFSGLNHIMLEVNYSHEILQENVNNGTLNIDLAKRIMKSHFSLENAKEFLKVNDLKDTKNIMLIHLSSGNSNAGIFQSEIERLTGKPVYVAKKDMEIELEGEG